MKHLIGLKYTALPLVSAVLLVFSLPPWNISPLVWIGFVPLLIFLKNPTYTTTQKLSGACLTGFAYFLVVLSPLMSIETSWFSMRYAAAVSLLWKIGIVFLSLYASLVTHTLWAALYVLFQKKMVAIPENIISIFMLPCLWVFVEGLRTLSAFGMGWGNIAYNIANTPYISPIAYIFGIYGVVFFIFVINTLFAQAILSIQNRGNISTYSMSLFLTPLVLLTAIWGHGTYIITTHVYGSTQKKIALVEIGNIPKHISIPDQYEHIISRAQTAASNSDVVVLPENAFPLFLLDTKTQRLVPHDTSTSTLDVIFESLIDTSVTHQGTVFVVGIHTEREGKRFNSIMVLHNGLITDIYDKRTPLPFFEKNGSLFANNRTSVHRGSEQKNTLDLETFSAQPLLCSEILYPQLLSSQSNQPIIHLSNNGVLQSERAEKYNLSVAQMRSLENRSYILHSEKRGLSTIIDPFGRIQNLQKENGVLYGSIFVK